MRREVTVSRGPILNITPQAVLFEFSLPDEDDVHFGIVKPQSVEVGGRLIPAAAASNPEILSKYLEIGDELRCSKVVKSISLKKQSYQEENEETGEMHVKTVKPNWSAVTAEKLVCDDHLEVENPFFSASNELDSVTLLPEPVQTCGGEAEGNAEVTIRHTANNPNDASESNREESAAVTACDVDRNEVSFAMPAPVPATKPLENGTVKQLQPQPVRGAEAGAGAGMEVGAGAEVGKETQMDNEETFDAELVQLSKPNKKNKGSY